MPLNILPQLYSMIHCLITLALPFVLLGVIHKWGSHENVYSPSYQSTLQPKQSPSWQIADCILYYVPIVSLALSMCFLFSFLLLIFCKFSPNLNAYFQDQSTDYIYIGGDAPSLVLSALLGVMAMLSICTAIKHSYHAVISVRSMLLADGADKCIVLAITYYLSSSVLQIIDFFYRLSQKNTQEAEEISLILQGVSVFFLFFTVLRTLLLLHKILKVFLQEDAKLLCQLYATIHNQKRKITNELRNPDHVSLDACMDYLCASLFDSKKKDTLQYFDHKKIQSIFLLDEYEMFPANLKKHIWIFSFLVLLLFHAFSFSLLLFLFPYDAIHFCIIYICVCIIIDIVGCFIIFYRKKGLHKLFIYITMCKWGFKTGDTQKTVYFFENCKLYFSNKMGKQYQKRLLEIYCIVSLFRNCLDAGEEIATHCLNRIAQDILKNHCGYVLYTVCLQLFFLHYPSQKRYVSEQIKTLQDSVALDTDIIAHNTSEFLKDMLRKRKVEASTNIFSMKQTVPVRSRK